MTVHFDSIRRLDRGYGVLGCSVRNESSQEARVTSPWEDPGKDVRFLFDEMLIYAGTDFFFNFAHG